MWLLTASVVGRTTEMGYVWRTPAVRSGTPIPQACVAPTPTPPPLVVPEKSEQAHRTTERAGAEEFAAIRPSLQNWHKSPSPMCVCGYTLYLGYTVFDLRKHGVYRRYTLYLSQTSRQPGRSPYAHEGGGGYARANAVCPGVRRSIGWAFPPPGWSAEYRLGGGWVVAPALEAGEADTLRVPVSLTPSRLINPRTTPLSRPATTNNASPIGVRLVMAPRAGPAVVAHSAGVRLSYGAQVGLRRTLRIAT